LPSRAEVPRAIKPDFALRSSAGYSGLDAAATKDNAVVPNSDRSFGTA